MKKTVQRMKMGELYIKISNMIHEDQKKTA